VYIDLLLYRKRKMDMEQQMLAWRVLYEDMEFMGSVASSTGSSAVWPSFSAYVVLALIFELCQS